MQAVIAEGDSIDAAIAAALATLGVTRDRVEIEILSNATRGILGFGGRKARVRATLRRPITEESEVRPIASAAPEVPSASATRLEGPPPPAAAPASVEVPPPAAAPIAAPPPVVVERDEDEEPELPEGPRAERRPVPTLTVDSATIAHAAQVLEDLVTRIGVESTVTASGEGDRILLQLTGDTSGVLIGRRGQMLDALEYVVNRIVSRDEGASAHIVIDSENYRERRQTALEDMARRMAEQAKKKRKPVTLNPMSPRDRRIVHLVLQGDRTLTTRSSGKGFYRKLVIIPEGVGRGSRAPA